MGEISGRDVTAALGPVNELIVREVLRTGATQLEFKRALAFAKGPANANAVAYSVLTETLQRLVDLLTVALEQRPERPRGASVEGGHRAA
ncbi:hypothetical protein DWF00_23775 [Bosea caraganae]|uniref:Uncharacterized protein n=1 Tax=Bosea caraganae TaxID=2763117 RepID=A0A370L1Z3_9HYPH|nr:hypothetical protein [Bosea caraganae]RDJ22138.1 hypothetical protein DWE98_19770 [Bosea caraganae]RDJ22775.1 hypothetical protein DWF00_23775 [Bosea caraganae]